MIGHNANHQKSAKIAKIAILTKNSNFFKVAGSVRKMDIWPEMGPWGVLEPFCTRNRYLKSFRSNFKSFLKNRFFWLFHLWDHPKYDRRIFYGPGKSDIEISTGPNTSKLFQKKKPSISLPQSGHSPIFVGWGHFAKIGYFHKVWFIREITPS